MSPQTPTLANMADMGFMDEISWIERLEPTF